MTAVADGLKVTPLFDQHVQLGARMVPFAGWSMPIQYEGVIAEHRAVRESAGLFDVSHMGQFWLSGSTAHADLQRLTSNNSAALNDGDAQYTLLTNERGGIEDDLIAYRFAPDTYLLVVNAANIANDLQHILGRVSETTTVRDASADTAMFALQGPRAMDVLRDTCGIDITSMRPFQFVEAEIDGAPVTVATTGYTGEAGCEILMENASAPDIWDRLLSDARCSPVGLGARDTLRLEVCYPLHGNDIDATTTPVEAGLGWVCHWDEPFTGSDVLLEQRSSGPHRKLVAIAAVERGIPRQGCPVLIDGAVAGEVTSGTMSPSLGIGIALAYVSAANAVPGQTVTIDVRGRQVQAEIRPKPLYTRKEHS